MVHGASCDLANPEFAGFVMRARAFYKYGHFEIMDVERVSRIINSRTQGSKQAQELRETQGWKTGNADLGPGPLGPWAHLDPGPLGPWAHLGAGTWDH